MESDPEVILAQFKQMGIECQNLASKINELGLEKEEHRLVVESLEKLTPERKAFRLVGGVLVEKTVGEILPLVTNNYTGIQQLIATLKTNLDLKDAERKAFKEKQGIMTQEEREMMMRSQAVAAAK